MGEFWKWARDHDGHTLFRHLDTYPGAVDALKKLSKKHEIVIITTKPVWAIHDTFAWIAQHRIPTAEVHIKDAKWKVACDFYLDDGPHVIDSLVKHRPEATVCRFVRPWNHAVRGAVDITDWEQFVAKVDSAPRQPK
jgi:5'(3')-deoxyribonucleotidase